MKTLRIVLFVLIIIGIGLLLTQKTWVPRLVSVILDAETGSTSDSVQMVKNSSGFEYSTRAPLSIKITVPEGFKYSLEGERDKNNNLIKDWHMDIYSENGLHFSVCEGCTFPMEECGGLSNSMCVEKDVRVNGVIFASFSEINNPSKFVIMIGSYLGKEITVWTKDKRQLTQEDSSVVSDIIRSIRSIK